MRRYLSHGQVAAGAIMAIALLAAPQAQAACNTGRNPTLLNVSHDLRRLNIADQNIKPGNPGFDVTPAFSKAVTYAESNGCTKIIGDPGTYYFKTQYVDKGITEPWYIWLNGANNLAIDFPGSTFIFQQPAVVAFRAQNCNNCTVQGMAIDYRILPFTQLTVQKIDQKNQVVVVQPLPGYANLYQLAKTQAPYKPFYVAFDLTSGTINYAVSGAKLIIPSSQVDRLPFSAFTPVLSDNEMHPGDVMIVAARGGGPAIFIVNGQQVTIKNVTIYTSAGPGIEANTSSDVDIDHLTIESRPQTTRLADVAAGGVELNDMGANNAVLQSTIIRAQDDSIAGHVSSTYTGFPPDNLVVVGNKIENSYLARGIAFTSVAGAHITQNTVSGTQQAGIYVGGWGSATLAQPVSRILVTNNTLTNADIGPTGVNPEMLGAIEVMYYYGRNGQAVSTPLNSDVFISKNTINGTLRSAIWIGNVTTGAVNQNSVSNFGLSNGSLGNDHHLNNGLEKCASALFRTALVGWFNQAVANVTPAPQGCLETN